MAEHGLWELVRKVDVLPSIIVAGAYTAIAPDAKFEGPDGSKSMAAINFQRYEGLRVSLTGQITPEVNSRVGIWVNEVDGNGVPLVGSTLAKTSIDSTAIIDAGTKSISLLLSACPGITPTNSVLDSAGNFIKWQTLAYETAPYIGIYLLFALGPTGILNSPLNLELWGLRT